MPKQLNLGYTRGMSDEQRATLRSVSLPIDVIVPSALDVVARRLRIEEAINIAMIMGFAVDWKFPGPTWILLQVSRLLLVFLWLSCIAAFFSNRGRIHWELWTVRFSSFYLCWTLLSLSWGGAPLAISYSPAITSVCVAMYFNYILDRFTVTEFARLLIWALTIVFILSIIAVAYFPSVGLASAASDLNPQNYGAWQGVFHQKNRLGIVCSLGFAICLGFRPKTSVNRIWRWGLFLLTVILTIGSRSRETWIADISIVLVAFFLGFARGFEPKSRFPILIGATILTVFFVFVAYANLDAILALFGRDRTLTGRSTIWEGSMLAISRRPWLGYGTYGFWNTPRAWDVTVRAGWQVTSAHNAYLETIIDYGIIGFVIFLPIPVSSFLFTFRAIMSYSLRNLEMFIYMIISILIQSFAGSTITWSVGISFIVLLFAVANLEKVERSGFMSLPREGT